jgi:hypothetical protein
MRHGTYTELGAPFCLEERRPEPIVITRVPSSPVDQCGSGERSRRASVAEDMVPAIRGKVTGCATGTIFRLLRVHCNSVEGSRVVQIKHV